MDPVDIATLQRVVGSLNDSNIEPFVKLMAQDMTWQGAQPVLRWWRHRPG